jgi:glycosyltransferase involved in cell wall biosynthesis
MPTVLLIAPGYPPENPVGAERIIKFEKFLPEFGFQTCVLTMAGQGQLPSDATKRVYRAVNPGQLYRPLAQRLLAYTQQKAVRPSAAQQVPPRRGMFEGTSLQSLRNWLLDWFAIPDLQITWLPAAVWCGLQAIQVERVDIILSTSPPESAHLVAACLAAMTHKPWVADFRDGWLFEPLKPVLHRNPLRRRLEERLERLVVARANAVVSVSQPITDYFCSAHPAFRAQCHTITNGYDPDDWHDLPPVPHDPSKLRIVYTGAFSQSRTTQDPRPFLHALQALHGSVRDKLEVLLIGAFSESEQQYLATLDLGNVIRVMGWMSKKVSLAYQLTADVLLLVASAEKSVATSKLYEYLYAGRPILAVSAVDTAAALIVTQSQAGWVVDGAENQAIVDCLMLIFDRWQQKKLVSRTTGIARYHRRELTRHLACLLDTVLTTTRQREQGEGV